jgi:hypothetical protein
MFVSKDFSDVAANPFDDRVMPLTANDLLSPLTTTGVLKDANAVLNANFTNITAIIVADAIANRTGTAGSRTYPLRLTALLNALPLVLNVPSVASTDSWNRQITYTLTTSPIASGTSGGAVAFTLTSGGPDGAIDPLTTTITPAGDDRLSIVYVNQLQQSFNTVGW